MNAEPGTIPPRAIVEVVSEPTPELFEQNLGALTSLLRLALLSGTEMTLPTALRLLLDAAQTVVASDRQLVILHDRRASGAPLQAAGHFDPPPIPGQEENLMHRWVGRAGKPVVAQAGQSAEMDGFLQRVGARSAAATPLFLEHEWAGSVQLFRGGDTPFGPTDGRLLWLLSLLAESQMARIHIVQQLTHMAFTDYLTGLRARGYFEQALEQEVHRSVRRSGSCGLLLADLDGFKAVNDYYGHPAGDEVLRQFARVLTRDMRDIDTVARFGGDEFAIILPDVDDAGARFVATRVREAVRNAIFRIPESGAEVRLTLSLGVALCPGDERSPDQLIRAADLALYQAKQRGKDRPFFWHEMRRSI